MAYLQSEKINLDESKLNFDEQKVVAVLRKSKKPMTIVELARAAFPQARSDARPPSESKNNPPGYRRTLNALRRVIASHRVKKVKSGIYEAV